MYHVGDLVPDGTGKRKPRLFCGIAADKVGGLCALL
jgi:hypothetical protein